MAATAHLPDFDKLWNYDKPAETEAKFRALLPKAEESGDPEYHLQLLTQLARTQSLQRKFPEAHKILDEVEPKLGPATPVAEVRYLLERGRAFNSDRKLDQARPLFLKAYDLGIERKLDFHAVDAAHMMAIVERDFSQQMEWNLKALKLAENSKNQRANGWLGSLYNNIGWTYHDHGQFEDALAMFKKALAFHEKKGGVETVRIAKWCVARALRSLQRLDEALEIQKALEAEFEKAGERDGYVFEELGELFLLKNEKDDAKKYFGLAYDELFKDAWLRENEAKRLDRLKELAGR